VSAVQGQAIPPTPTLPRQGGGSETISLQGGGGSGGSFKIPSLDGIRAVAVGIVFLAHAGLGLSLPRLGYAALPGEFGVTVFFFLSGFLITTLLRVEFARTGSISLRDFYLRRVLRIFPPFYIVLVLATALTAVGVLAGPRLGAGSVAAQALYLTNYDIIATNWWDGRAPGSWIYWSLAVEEHFYLFFPLLYLLLLRFLPSRRRQLAVLLGLCAAVLAWRCFLVYAGHVPKERTYIATDTRIDSILFGCALAVMGNPVVDRSRFSDRWWKGVWLPLGLVVLIASLAISFMSESFKESLSYTLQGLGLVPVFVCAMRFPRWFAFPLLNWRPMAFVGVISYSLYLVHPTVLYGIDRYLPTSMLGRGVAAALVSLGLALGIYLLVERPIARLRRRLSHLHGRPAAEPAAVGRPRVAAEL
jgi:peptidoglycan/LPS O-acetylase OafA/YrhL